MANKVDHDIFISYAHIDNRTVGGGKSGFVTRLCEHIDTLGYIKRGKPIEIFCDSRMANGTEFATEIENALERTTLFVPIVSASWQQSEWCDREFKKFAFFDGMEEASATKEHQPRRPFFPILFETEAGKVGGYLGTLNMRYRFRFGMTDEAFLSVASPMVDELVAQLRDLAGRPIAAASGRTS